MRLIEEKLVSIVCIPIQRPIITKQRAVIVLAFITMLAAPNPFNILSSVVFGSLLGLEYLDYKRGR